ncbi:hypothetical protein FKP32DRAFT_1574894 [Trametes sanguinea]|nr:hypothetical protein FKP32DRAFT_1574894 [Trametes sanguinea]
MSDFPYYRPFPTSSTTGQSEAVYSVLMSCVPCNIMCMRRSTPGHVRYQHGMYQSHRTVSYSKRTNRPNSTSCEPLGRGHQHTAAQEPCIG